MTTQSLVETRDWFDDDGFWTEIHPIAFDATRWMNARAEVEQMAKLLGLSPGSAVLDLCCGPGRHCLEWARRGYVVTGVDRTPAYVRKATSLMTAQALTAEFVAADIRDFRRPGAFAGIYNVFSSFGYFEDEDDDRGVCANVYASLRDRGRFLLETISKESVARTWRDRYWMEKGGVILLVEQRITRNWTWLEGRWTVVGRDGRRDFRVAQRLYSAAELATLLRSCGFREVAFFGSLAGAPYDHTAERLVAVAER
jgi:SAM-dependent methyltransferase